jgi:hypothetical protein
LRVEWEDEDGGVEVTIFSGPDAREPATRYADLEISAIPRADVLFA